MGKSDEDIKKPKGKGKKKASKLTLPVELLGQYTELDYWHGYLPNEDTGNLLQEDGNYLLRRSVELKDGPILLSVRKGKKVINVGIDESENGFILEREFDTMQTLIDYYQVRKIPIKVDNMAVVLSTAVRRKHWELSHKMVKIGEELGQGSYGTVYKALLRYPRQKESIPVAAKVLFGDIDACAALWKEVRTMLDYKHPNIVKFYGVCNDATPYYLIMEFVNGGSVDKYLIEVNPKASYHKRTVIAYEASSGIEYLHSQGCIHRDIAARNLLIDTVTKVADFGLSRKSKKYKVDVEKPMNLRWIAPDVFQSEVVDKATDVYAFGVTLFELFSVPYKVPYGTWNADTVYEKVVEGGFRLKPPVDTPKDIGNLMRVRTMSNNLKYTCPVDPTA